MLREWHVAFTKSQLKNPAYFSLHNPEAALNKAKSTMTHWGPRGGLVELFDKFKLNFTTCKKAGIINITYPFANAPVFLKRIPRKSLLHVIAGNCRNDDITSSL